jgi:hypothetical protein
MSETTIVLGTDEALVLFELLHRWEDEDRDLGLIPGEATALWSLSGTLERALVEPFDVRYRDLVGAARQRLYDRGGA